MPEQPLIDAIALVIAEALAAHGVRPAEGNPTLRQAIEKITSAYGGRDHRIPEVWVRGAGTAARTQPQPQRIQPPTPPPPKPKRATRRNGFGRDDWVL